MSFEGLNVTGAFQGGGIMRIIALMRTEKIRFDQCAKYAVVLSGLREKGTFQCLENMYSFIVYSLIKETIPGQIIE